VVSRAARTSGGTSSTMRHINRVVAYERRRSVALHLAPSVLTTIPGKPVRRVCAPSLAAERLGRKSRARAYAAGGIAWGARLDWSGVQPDAATWRFEQLDAVGANAEKAGVRCSDLGRQRAVRQSAHRHLDLWGHGDAVDVNVRGSRLGSGTSKRNGVWKDPNAKSTCRCSRRPTRPSSPDPYCRRSRSQASRAGPRVHRRRYASEARNTSTS
jgi:hypothetical protein